MALFKKTKSNIIINNTLFFEGNNIIKKLLDSTFGLFQATINSLNISMDNFKLPQLIIIGNESCGKSSLINNILKCNIFPTNKKFCTKTPIKLELINSDKESYEIIFRNETFFITKKEDIFNKILQIMDSLDTICGDEINIKFYHPEIINSIFYDLPGIIEYPEELRLNSISINNKYINQPNTIIICVIQANSTRLRANQSLGLVIASNKCENCIIVLSMVDLLHEDDIEDLFIKRLLKKNNELNNINIYKIIGIVNKLKNDDNDFAWFNGNILTFIEDKETRKNINNNITIENLLISLDKLYHNFIKINWKQQCINEIDKFINKLQINYSNKNVNIIEYINFNNIFNNYGFKLLIENNIKNYDDELNNLIKFYSNIKNTIINRLIISINDNNNNLIKIKNIMLEKYINIINDNFINIDKWFYAKIDKFKYNLYDINQINKFYKQLEINCKRHIQFELENIIFEYDNEYIIEKDFEDLLIKYNNLKKIISNIE
jgi:hypothetical protein